MDNLVLLKRIACDYNLLIVDDSIHIVKKLKEFLGKFFVDIDLAYNGLEALDKIKSKSYDIVITDINMPKLDGNMFVEELINYRPNSQIIVISAFGHDENVVKLNKFGIIEFIQKPINNELLIKSLLQAIDNIKLIKNKDSAVSFSIDSNIFEKIIEFKKSNEKIELINFFKGVSINQPAYIQDITPNTLTIKTSNSQYYLIKCEKRTVILIEDIVLKTDLHFEDKRNEELILKKFELLNRSPKDRVFTRVVPDKSFTISRLYKGESLSFDIIALSENSVSVKTENQEEIFLQDDTIDLVINFDLFYDTMHNKNNLKHIKLKSKSHILRIDEFPNGIRKIVFLLNLNDIARKTLRNYILQRESTILNEVQEISNDIL